MQVRAAFVRQHVRSECEAQASPLLTRHTRYQPSKAGTMHGTAANVRGPAYPYFSRPMTQVLDLPNFQAVAARRADATRMYDIDCSGRRVLLTGLRCARFRPRASVHAGQLQEHVLDPHRRSIGCPGRSGHASPWRQCLHSANPTEALSS